ncbi:hypothetical protein AMJ52_04405 [candidate division TA06 bacterium DG_78]|uniref:4Fe-4S ferredoxin-type domain-containing protein n=1 Tax=candidate division TA06 bacterium DG_78 TaxID=1703772 RepID=A0A0S7YE45_UNCT6|nr:MAG: hypothetical protein AMJ52_04405 [candidate division TA06 bacterium DG_78]
MKKTRVYIKESDNLRASIATLFHDIGLEKVSGKKVFVKPNMLRTAQPDENVVTHPEIISETVSFLMEAGADVIVGDNPAPNKRCNELVVAEQCGFLEAAHGCFRNIGRYPRKVKRLGNILKEIYVSREIMDCDVLVSLPKFKSHQLTTMSIAIKNQFGIIPGGLKPYIHALFPKISDFSRVLLEIYNIRPPDLTIVDCINIIDATGKRFTPKKIIGGTNGHAIDYTCALMAGINPYRIPTLAIAKDENLFDPMAIEYHGEIEKIKGYSVPFGFPLRNSIVEFVARILYRIWLSGAPVIDSSLCSRCMSCENVCPKRAIRNQIIDYRKCIKCYCCLEVCPNQAIKTKFRL